MRSFLGVPIVAPEGVIGAFYLTEKIGAPDFSDEDEELIGLLAAHAAIAITNARLHEQTRELSIVAERNRLALDLHDAVSQKLFGLVLSAEAARTLLDRDPAAARDQVAKLQALAQEALDELRSLVFELRPADLERDGLGGALRKHVELVRRLGPPRDRARRRRRAARPTRRATARCSASPRRRSRTRSGTPRRRTVAVRLDGDDGRLLLEVEDDGVGFDPQRDRQPRSRRLGLTSMEERARRLGGTARDPLRARAPARPCGLRSAMAEPIRVLDRRRPRRRPRGPARVPRAAGRDRGRGRGGRRRGGDRGRRRGCGPDVILMDLVMPRLDGVARDARAARAASRRRA